MASRAFTARFSTTSRHCAASAKTGHSSESKSISRSICLPSRTPEHIRLLTQHRIQIEPFSPHYLAAIQAQALQRQFLCAAHCLRNQPYLLFRITFAFLKPLGHRQNHRQQIVEVMRNRSRDSSRQIEILPPVPASRAAAGFDSKSRI